MPPSLPCVIDLRHIAIHYYCLFATDGPVLVWGRRQEGDFLGTVDIWARLFLWREILEMNILFASWLFLAALGGRNIIFPLSPPKIGNSAIRDDCRAEKWLFLLFSFFFLFFSSFFSTFFRQKLYFQFVLLLFPPSNE